MPSYPPNPSLPSLPSSPNQSTKPFEESRRSAGVSIDQLDEEMGYETQNVLAQEALELETLGGQAQEAQFAPQAFSRGHPQTSLLI